MIISRWLACTYLLQIRTTQNLRTELIPLFLLFFQIFPVSIAYIVFSVEEKAHESQVHFDEVRMV